MPYVYMLRCADGTLYIGHTNDLASREQTHNEGLGSRYTALRRPVKTVYSEELESTADAIARERQLKRWTAKKKEALIAGDLSLLKLLSARLPKIERSILKADRTAAARFSCYCQRRGANHLRRNAVRVEAIIEDEVMANAHAGADRREGWTGLARFLVARPPRAPPPPGKSHRIAQARRPVSADPQDAVGAHRLGAGDVVVVQL